MNTIDQLVNSVINGDYLSKSDDFSFIHTTPIYDLCSAADRIRKYYCSDHADLCTIINGRSGRCSENCKFCAQSSHYHTNTKNYSFLSQEEILADAKHLDTLGIHRYSIVTAGRTLEGEDLTHALDTYSALAKNTNFSLCASHGFLTKYAFEKLKASGVTRYHANIETSRRYFPQICTSHTYEDKLSCIQLAKEAGLEVCSGGILGLGETMQDRIDMAFDLRELQVDSIPLNILTPIPGTPLEQFKPISEEEFLRSIAMFRFVYPTVTIRLAAGRSNLTNYGELAFLSGANGTITGDMLTTSGSNIESDKNLLQKLNYSLL